MADDNKSAASCMQLVASQAPPRGILRWRRALLWHSLAFLTIVALTWCEEAFYFFHQLFRQTPEQPDYVDAAITTLIIALVWVVSGMGIHRLVVRLNDAERFLHICAWCRRIESDEVWMSLESYFAQETIGVLSHGICPDCCRKMDEEGVEVAEAPSDVKDGGGPDSNEK